eukprot:gene15519-3917_t
MARDGGGWEADATQSAACYAVEENNKDCLELICAAGADLGPGPDGVEPVHLAASKKFTKCISVLAKHGADLLSVGKDGKTALEGKGKKKVKGALLKYLDFNKIFARGGLLTKAIEAKDKKFVAMQMKYTPPDPDDIMNFAIKLRASLLKAVAEATNAKLADISEGDFKRKLLKQQASKSKLGKRTTIRKRSSFTSSTSFTRDGSNEATPETDDGNGSEDEIGDNGDGDGDGDGNGASRDRRDSRGGGSVTEPVKRLSSATLSRGASGSSLLGRKRRSSQAGPIVNPDIKLKPVKAHLDLYLRDLAQLCPGIDLPRWYREAIIGPAEYIAEELLLEEVEVARSRTEVLRQHASNCLLGNRRIYDSVWLATQESEHAQEYIANTARRAHDCNAQFLDRQLQQHSVVVDLCIEAGTIHPLFSNAIMHIGKVAKCELSISPLKSPCRIITKTVYRKVKGAGVNYVSDVVRAMLVADSLEHCQQIEEAIVKHPHLLVTRWKDRVAEPSTGGWRDQLINVRVRGEGPHVCEIQVVLKSMLTARKGLDGHEAYAESRAASELVEATGEKCFFEGDNTDLTRAAAFHRANSGGEDGDRDGTSDLELDALGTPSEANIFDGGGSGGERGGNGAVVKAAAADTLLLTKRRKGSMVTIEKLEKKMSSQAMALQDRNTELAETQDELVASEERVAQLEAKVARLHAHYEMEQELMAAKLKERDTQLASALARLASATAAQSPLPARALLQTHPTTALVEVPNLLAGQAGLAHDADAKTIGSAAAVEHIIAGSGAAGMALAASASASAVNATTSQSSGREGASSSSSSSSTTTTQIQAAVLGMADVSPSAKLKLKQRTTVGVSSGQSTPRTGSAGSIRSVRSNSSTGSGGNVGSAAAAVLAVAKRLEQQPRVGAPPSAGAGARTTHASSSSHTAVFPSSSARREGGSGSLGGGSPRSQLEGRSSGFGMRGKPLGEGGGSSSSKGAGGLPALRR